MEFRCDKRTAAHGRQALLLGWDNRSSPTKLFRKLFLWSLRCHFVLWPHFELETDPFSCTTQQFHQLWKHHSISYPLKVRQMRSFFWGQSLAGSLWGTISSIRLFWVLEWLTQITDWVTSKLVIFFFSFRRYTCPFK